ncbi:MAG TPA: DNA polymerase III subunit delta' [Candidatus Binatia bacterium]
MGFAQIVGHSKQLETLRLALAHGRLHHAYLFVGAAGLGKKTIGLSLAKAIHCSVASGDFCGECADCARIQDGNHPDVRLIEPLAGKKEISIQQIRELEKELNLRSFSGNKKIVILDPATLMNLSAQNALLKTLEEPPNDSLLILIAASVGELLPTLRSRCLRVSFAPLAQDQVVAFLVSEKKVPVEEAKVLAAMSKGSLEAVAAVDSQELLARRHRWIVLLLRVASGDYRTAAGTAEALAGNKEESLRFLEWAESWYRDLLVYTVTQNQQDVVNVDMLPQIEQLAAAVELEHLLARIAEAKGAVVAIQRNLNRRMVLENLLLNAAETG